VKGFGFNSWDEDLPAGWNMDTVGNPIPRDTPMHDVEDEMTSRVVDLEKAIQAAIWLINHDSSATAKVALAAMFDPPDNDGVRPDWLPDS
jgi:hypothetical protein